MTIFPRSTSFRLKVFAPDSYTSLHHHGSIVIIIHLNVPVLRN